MSDAKQVKVDNWGIYFLQRLKHFFNRTDYCDLTLQFQDNAQLKVHRLVLNACTEYFELLERTCEMYEDCLVMPDDLQADVVVPIVNFMYTGHLEFKMDLLEKLYQTSQIMKMPVLTKLLESHRPLITKPTNRENVKRYPKIAPKPAIASTSSTSYKRSYSSAFNDKQVMYRDRKLYLPKRSNDNSQQIEERNSTLNPPSYAAKKLSLGEPRPTRYELPEELAADNIFENSFCNISYTSKPLMVHPETTKNYSKPSYGDSSARINRTKSTLDIVECKKISKKDSIFDDDNMDQKSDEIDLFPSSFVEDTHKNTNQLFDQILDSNITIETKDKQAANLDHAKIISEVLKKYPHLVKNNKNIKLKILNTGSKTKKQGTSTNVDKPVKIKKEKDSDYTFETDVLDSKEAARLIALGADNVTGPWICLICGAPGKALHFTSYYNFRRHLVEVHNEKPIPSICEYCGLKSIKRNHMVHHLYSKHGVEPPAKYNFPKCKVCNYVALTEAFLLKHKMTHSNYKNFRCNVCPASFNSSSELLLHIQITGHKYSADRKLNLQCIYCLKIFLRESNLYTHLKTCHKQEAKDDGIIDLSDDDIPVPVQISHKPKNIKVENQPYEPTTSYDNTYEDLDIQYQIQPDGNIQVISSKKQTPTTSVSNSRQKILNTGFGSTGQSNQSKVEPNSPRVHDEFLNDATPASPNNTNQEEDIVLIDNNEYVMKGNQLFPRKTKPTPIQSNDEFIISDILESQHTEALHPVTHNTNLDYTNIQSTNVEQTIQQPNMVIKKGTTLNQPIQIVVSNEEEYKALMASNHPIIFDNGDSNKTLTVLTAPHPSSLNNTAIDLDNAQSNDMMIIQEDYPLNVTETIPPDNSNIVVVYSHPVHDPSKQYQILTTQGIEAQFVQSSAIVTQNYETVTTSAPIISGHVIDSQVSTWSANVEQNIDSQHISMAPLGEEVHTEIVSAKSDSNTLHDLPEVSLSQGSEKTQTDQVNQTDDTIIESNDLNDGHIGQNVDLVVEEESHNKSDVMVSGNQSEHVTENEISTMETSEEVSEVQIAHNTTDNEIEHIEQLQNEVLLEPAQENIDHEANQSNCSQVEVILDTNQNINTDQNLSVSLSHTEKETVVAQNEVTHNNDTADDIQTSQSDTPISDKNKEMEFIEVTKEQIQNLASEWSEDECETTPDGNDTTATSSNQTDNQAPTTENRTIIQETPSLFTKEPVEIEESIENIQQEVEKQMSDSIESETQAEESMNVSNVHEPELARTEDPLAIGDSQVKISSLLNDWEDNDSQENPTEQVQDKTEEETQETTEVDTEVQDISKKDDNIKSLVSDWDEEEEENKE